MKVSAKVVVHGLVQGVGFRYFIHRHASRLGLTGYARNRPDGNVEIELEGERGFIQMLVGEVRKGPTLSQVQDVEVEWGEFQQQFKEFEIRH